MATQFNRRAKTSMPRSDGDAYKKHDAGFDYVLVKNPSDPTSNRMPSMRPLEVGGTSLRVGSSRPETVEAFATGNLLPGQE